jgi:hypothetical protein
VQSVQRLATCSMVRDSAGARIAQVSTATRLRLRWSGVRISVGTRFLSYLNVQTGSRFHLASYALGTRTPSQRKGGRVSEVIYSSCLRGMVRHNFKFVGETKWYKDTGSETRALYSVSRLVQTGLGFTQPPTQRVPKSLSRALTRPRRGADYSTQFSVKVINVPRHTLLHHTTVSQV